MKWRSVQHTTLQLIQLSGKSHHHRLVTAGLFVGICYSPFWITDLVSGTLNGGASVLMLALVALGVYRLWQNRQQLAASLPAEDDRFLGHALILCGILIAPWCWQAEWSQKLSWLLILLGIGCSNWGLSAFRRYPLSVALICLGFFPQPTTVGQLMWQAFTPPQMLENFMAWSGGLGLRAIGQAAVSNGAMLTLPGGSVQVIWGCSGFDMATIMAVASLVLGLFLKRPASNVLYLMIIGIALALIANIPRIMLMAYANAYWGKESFHFWHGVWGGQIFSTIMFTIYYYIVMAMIKKRSPRRASDSSL
jgi:exosortase